ncbi:hypothetical protein NXV51_11660 [Bacteroides uniformis]|nr:hypothetical protein [Bacteroides uniformis]
MKNYISRPLYIKRIEPFIDKSIIKVITGQRKIGKSYILFTDIRYHKEKHTGSQYHFVDKEQLAFTEIGTTWIFINMF